MEVKPFFDRHTFTVTYVVYDSTTNDCVVIDPVRDYEASTGTVSSFHHDLVKDFITENNLKPHYVSYLIL